MFLSISKELLGEQLCSAGALKEVRQRTSAAADVARVAVAFVFITRARAHRSRTLTGNPIEFESAALGCWGIVSAPRRQFIEHSRRRQSQ